jgi:uncharacterized membrane protein
VAVAVRGFRDAPSLRGVLFFVLAGLIGTATGRLLRFVSIDQVGASVTAALNNLYPFISTALAILVLGEEVTLAIVAGTVVIVGGTVLLSASGGRMGFQRRHVIYPVLSATCFGVVAVLRKLGLRGMGPVEGLAVNVLTALVVVSAVMLLVSRRDALRCDARSLAYFVVAGVAENGGVFLALLSLSLGTVSVVAPLAGTAPLYALVFSYFFLRGVERLTLSVALGTLCIVLGVYMITAL